MLEIDRLDSGIRSPKKRYARHLLTLEKPDLH